MNKVAFLAVAVLLPGLSHAIEMGLGASARSDDATIYLPIDLNPGLRVEPFFSFGETESSVGGVTVESEYRTVGAGVFGRMEMTESLQPYFGGRVSYVERETSIAATSYDQDGFRIEPAIGAEFFVTARVSVGLEAFLFHEDLDDEESNGTGTRLLLRIMP